MTALAEIARWCYKNPGVWDTKQIHAENPQFGESTIKHVMGRLADTEPKIFVRLGSGNYVIRAPESVEAAEPLGQAARNGSAPQSTFEEILPDDDDLYPPLKIQIYDHFRSKGGDQWFRVKDEIGKRGIFRYIEDD